MTPARASGGYTCELELIAARVPTGYNGKVTPGFSGHARVPVQGRPCIGALA